MHWTDVFLIVYHTFFIMSDHRNPIPTVDVILEKGADILLIKRRNEPFKDYLALPGGFVHEGEKVEEAIKREAREETSIEIDLTDILGVYSDPKRDPRGHILTIVFVGIIQEGQAKAGDDSKDVEWIPLDQVREKKIAFDHMTILSDYKESKDSGDTFWSSKPRSNRI
jgi:8-oxo-dGTP diphosphatase